MVRGALLGTLLGVMGAAAGLFASVAIYTIVKEDTSRLPGNLATGLVMVAFMVFLATPGAFVLGLPLASALRFILVNAPSRRLFLFLSAGAGMPLGLINLYLGHALLDVLSGRGIVLQPDRLSDPFLVPAAVCGGIGLGLGAAMAVWRETHPPARCWREWRGTC